MSRREYLMRLRINRRRLNRVIIDPHYEEKHGLSMTDILILRLVKLLDGFVGEAEHRSEEGFEYYASYPLQLDGKSYKLIWLLHPNETFVGVINAYRKD